MRQNRTFYTTIILLTALVIANIQIAAQDQMEKVKQFTNATLVNMISATELVSAIESQNAKGVSLDKIKEIDEKWMATSGEDEFIKSLLSNKCSKYLNSLRTEQPILVEIFAMDNKGALVGSSNKTSDYWQGDEDKFTKSYNNGNGEIHYGKISFDESTQAYVIQVSIPVKKSGKTIGAVTFGVDVEKIN